MHNMLFNNGIKNVYRKFHEQEIVHNRNEEAYRPLKTVCIPKNTKRYGSISASSVRAARDITDLFTRVGELKDS